MGGKHFPRRAFVWMLATGLATSGCAIKPAPSDVVRMSTYGIVQQIRCEVRDALRAIAANSIEANNPEFAARLRAKPALFHDLDLGRLDAETAGVLERYDQGAVGYDFTFDMTESNDASWTMDLFRGFSRGPLTVAVGAGNDLKRQNTRTFRNADTFLYLATQFPERFCTQARRSSNFQYPITGSIGLRESVATFISLNQSANLVGSEADVTVPVMVDTIEFTTTISGSVAPSVKLAPLGNGLQVVGSGLDFGATRIDRHKLIFGLSLPVDPRDGRNEGELIPVRRTVDAIQAKKVEAREEKKADFLDLLVP
jgi:hypothetical protein